MSIAGLRTQVIGVLRFIGRGILIPGKTCVLPTCQSWDIYVVSINFKCYSFTIFLEQLNTVHQDKNSNSTKHHNLLIFPLFTNVLSFVNLRLDFEPCSHWGHWALSIFSWKCWSLPIYVYPGLCMYNVHIGCHLLSSRAHLGSCTCWSIGSHYLQAVETSFWDDVWSVQLEKLSTAWPGGCERHGWSQA